MGKPKFLCKRLKPIRKTPLPIENKEPKERLKHVIHHRVYECPHCNFKDTGPFPIEKFQGGIGGGRTVRCPVCEKELLE